MLGDSYAFFIDRLVQLGLQYDGINPAQPAVPIR